MLKKFSNEVKYKRKSIARILDQAIKAEYEKSLANKKYKRVKTAQKRYV